MSDLFHASHSKIGRSTHAAGTAGAHVDYVCRSSACSAVVAEGMPAPKPGDRKQRNKARGWLDRQEAKMRKNGRVADKINIALPHELAQADRLRVIRAFMSDLADDQEPPPWLAALHDQGKDASNPHVHLVIHDHRDGKRVIGMSKKGSTDRIRESWERVCNQFLEASGSDIRIDRRSLAAQGTDRVPQKHIGPQARTIQRKHEADPEKHPASWKVAAVNDEIAAAEAQRTAEDARIVEVQQTRKRAQAIKLDVAMQERAEEIELAQWQREAREIEARRAADQDPAWFQHIQPDLPEDLPEDERVDVWKVAEIVAESTKGEQEEAAWAEAERAEQAESDQLAQITEAEIAQWEPPRQEHADNESALEHAAAQEAKAEKADAANIWQIVVKWAAAWRRSQRKEAVTDVLQAPGRVVGGWLSGRAERREAEQADQEAAAKAEAQRIEAERAAQAAQRAAEAEWEKAEWLAKVKAEQAERERRREEEREWKRRDWEQAWAEADKADREQQRKPAPDPDPLDIIAPSRTPEKPAEAATGPDTAPEPHRAPERPQETPGGPAQAEIDREALRAARERENAEIRRQNEEHEDDDPAPPSSGPSL